MEAAPGGLDLDAFGGKPVISPSFFLPAKPLTKQSVGHSFHLSFIIYNLSFIINYSL